MNNKFRFEVDCAVKSSPLGRVLANIFMVEPETPFIPNINDKVKLWKRDVDVTFCIIILINNAFI